MFDDLRVRLRLLPTGELKAHPPLLTKEEWEILRTHEKELVKYIRHRAEQRSAHEHDPRFSATWPESNEASKILENDRSRDRAMVSSMNREVAFVAIARRSGLRSSGTLHGRDRFIQRDLVVAVSTTWPARAGRCACIRAKTTSTSTITACAVP